MFPDVGPISVPPATSALVAAPSLPRYLPTYRSRVRTRRRVWDRGACPHKAHLRDDSSAAEQRALRASPYSSLIVSTCTTPHTCAGCPAVRRIAGEREGAEGGGGKDGRPPRRFHEHPRNTHASTFRSRDLKSLKLPIRHSEGVASESVLREHLCERDLSIVSARREPFPRAIVFSASSSRLSRGTLERQGHPPRELHCERVARRRTIETRSRN